MGQTFVHFMACSFSENFIKSFVWSPPPPPTLEGWRALLRGILGPSLQLSVIFRHNQSINQSQLYIVETVGTSEDPPAGYRKLQPEKTPPSATAARAAITQSMRSPVEEDEKMLK